MQRGHLMQKSAEKQQTGMAAILRLEETQLENLCAQFNNIYPVNYNCPGQTVISGPSKDLPEFYKAVKLSGGKALPLKVSGGFHSPFMADASKQFSEILKKLNFKPARIPLYSNYTGERYTENIHELLTKQICNPVRWETVVRNMICNGVDTFIEIGPGKTLCGLIKKINSNVQSFASDDMNNWAFAASEVQAC